MQRQLNFIYYNYIINHQNAMTVTFKRKLHYCEKRHYTQTLYGSLSLYTICTGPYLYILGTIGVEGVTLTPQVVRP